MYINKKLMALLCLVLAASMMMAAGCAGRTQPGVTQAQDAETIETTEQNQEVSMSESPLYYEDMVEDDFADKCYDGLLWQGCDSRKHS